MTAEELKHLKEHPGLYLMVGGYLVASINGKIYGVVIDEELRDDGWQPNAKVYRCILHGRVGNVGPTPKHPGH